jgi:hypothetical protein
MPFCPTAFALRELVKSALTSIGKVIFELILYKTRMRRLALLLSLALLPIAPATAARVGATPPATAHAALLHPLSMIKTADLDYGLIVVAGVGTAVIDPVNDTMSVTGGVAKGGGTPHAAAFIGAGSGLSLIYVQQPRTPVTLVRIGGTETMTATNFTMQAGNFYITLATGAFAFRVGATLNVGAGQVEGNYAGTFNVDAYYF